MSLFWKIILLLSMLFIAVALTYLSLAPSYVLQISVEEPRPSKRLEIRRDKIIVISNGKEPNFFDIAGDVYNPNISKVSLSMRQPKEVEFKKQGDFKVSNGSFLGTVQLGSAERPIISDENYPFIIDSGDDNSRLSEGNIQVQVKAVISYTSQGWMYIIAGIGLLASWLQVYQFFTQRGEVAKSHEDSPKIP